MATDEPKFALYVSSVEGRLVSRYGAGSRGAPSYIGARRIPRDPTSIVWDTELVVALTEGEVHRYAREYERAVVAKALKKRTRDEYLAQLERERAAAKPPATPTATPEPSNAAPAPSPAPDTKAEDRS